MHKNIVERPNRPALSDNTVQLTYAELWDSSRRFAGGLAEAGVGDGDHVLVMLDNSVDYFLAVAGLSFVGAVAVPVNTSFQGLMLTHLIETSKSRVAIAEAHYLPLLRDAGHGALGTFIVRSAGDAPAPGAGPVGVMPLSDVASGPLREPLDVGPWATQSILYTSGTTGPAKGVSISQAHAFTQAYLPHVQGPHDENDVLLVVCPMFHSVALFGGAYAAMHVGASAYILPRFSASAFWDEVNRAGATSCVLIGSMADFLLRQPPKPTDPDNSLRTLYSLPRPQRIAELMRRFGIERTATAYGQTEAGCLMSNQVTLDVPLDNPIWRSVGKLRPGWQVRLVDEHDMEVPEGEAGEIIVRPDDPWVIASGYINAPEASAEIWRNGWYHTGDKLRRDAEGYYYFTDRARDYIRRRGENISPAEVEREVMAHPDVLECAVVGVGDAASEQEVKAVVVVRPGSGLHGPALIEFLRDRMAYFAIPRYVDIVDDLPRTSTGKVQKSGLRTIESGTWDREAAGIHVARAHVVPQ
jgi:crotonobetaine/carnitine-CoA ligase